MFCSKTKNLNAPNPPPPPFKKKYIYIIYLPTRLNYQSTTPTPNPRPTHRPPSARLLPMDSPSFWKCWANEWWQALPIPCGVLVAKFPVVVVVVVWSGSFLGSFFGGGSHPRGGGSWWLAHPKKMKFPVVFRVDCMVVEVDCWHTPKIMDERWWLDPSFGGEVLDFLW